jgi:hypothetical protein
MAACVIDVPGPNMSSVKDAHGIAILPEASDAATAFASWSMQQCSKYT